MATYLLNSKADLARRDSIQTAVDNGDLPAMTTITKRPSDVSCWQGVFYGGQWYPPSDPRGAELVKLRYMLPAPKKTWGNIGICDVCGDKWVDVRYLTPKHPQICRLCWDAFAVWDEILDLADAMPFQEAQRIYLADAFCRQPNKIEVTPEPAEPPPVMLGEVEIQMGDSEYTRPGIVVGHSAQGKCLFVTLYLNGRMGKQRNWYPVHLRRRDDHLDLDTGGARGCTITLAEWQAFIDQVDARVSFISQKTIAFTPQLVKMARDVQARRRKEPTDAEWAVETAVDPQEDPGVLAAMVKKINQEVDAAPLDKVLDDLVENKFRRWVELEYGKVTKNLVFMNLSCERQAFGNLEQHFRKLHNRAYRPPKPKKQRVFPGPEDFDRLMPKYRYSLALANRGSELLPPKTPEYPPRPDITPRSDCFLVFQLNGLSEMISRNADDLVRKSAAALHNHTSLASQKSIDVTPDAPQIDKTAPISNDSDGTWVFTRVAQIKAQRGDVSLAVEQRWHDACKAGSAKRNKELIEAAPKSAPILPQLLQSKEDILEAIVMSKVDPSPERLTELYEAVIFGVEHYEKEEARAIFDGFLLQASPSGAFIHLAHPEHPNHITVGMTDMLTNKMEFCSSRGELKDFAYRVFKGMVPSTNPHLPGILMQQPIPEDAKQSPLRSGNNQHAEIAPEELPLFAGQDPEPAA